mgnify:CR=1 FL=1
MGYECYCANDVEAAIKIVRTTSGVRLIITDFQMPGKTGADLVRAVETKWGGHIKFIIMSGHALPCVEWNGVDTASYTLLKKPFDIDDLIGAVSAVLETTEEQL